MVMSWILTGMMVVSVIASVVLGNGSQLAAAIPLGAQKGITLGISIAGSICLWSGVGKLMEKAGFTGFLAKCLKPILKKLFPESEKDPALASALSANICANFLGLGNAATPMGIRAACILANMNPGGAASNSLCRLIVLNTASIQLIPASVAALRTAFGCSTPFDILPAVWITSICSVGVGLFAAFVFGRMWKH